MNQKSFSPPVILVIDDDAHFREALSLSLSQEFEVLIAGSGKEGIVLLNDQVAAVILDVKMQGMDGFETFVEIKKRSLYLPVIFHTAYQDYKDLYEVINEYHPFAYLYKNGGIFVLINTIKNAVSYYQQYQENQRLLREVQALNNDLQQSNEELKSLQIQLLQSSRLSTIGKLSSSIFHELSNPLTNIQMIAGLLQIELDDPKQPKIGEKLKKILFMVNRCVQIIQQLRKFGRSTNLALRDTSHVKELIDNALLLTEKRLELDHVQLHCIYEDDLPNVWVNRVLIEQVFMNLISNAREAMLNSSIKQLKIDVYTERPQWVVIQFKDSGAGIEQSHIEKIFQSFFTTKETGMGIGLSLCRDIIQKHQGTLVVKSQLEQGSVFEVRLPIAHS